MSDQSKAAVWKTDELTKRFLTSVRGAIPLAAEQLELLVRLAAKAQPRLRNFLDLGCGDGILGAALLHRFPQSHGVFSDFSPPMLAAAKARFAEGAENHVFIECDYSTPGWRKPFEQFGPYDAVVSGFSIHHQPDTRKRELYAEILTLLSPGGIFLNLEHVASTSPWCESASDELFVDSLYAFHVSNGGAKTHDEVGREYYHRPDKAANILAPVELQCQWLRECGYQDVDCYFKVFELALFGGVRR